MPQGQISGSGTADNILDLSSAHDLACGFVMIVRVEPDRVRKALGDFPIESSGRMQPAVVLAVGGDHGGGKDAEQIKKSAQRRVPEDGQKGTELTYK